MHMCIYVCVYIYTHIADLLIQRWNKLKETRGLATCYIAGFYFNVEINNQGSLQTVADLYVNVELLFK